MVNEGERDQELRELPVASIEPSLAQPRRHFDEAALEALAGSMRQRGVLNPVEQARACDTLMKELGLTQREIGERVGRSRGDDRGQSPQRDRQITAGLRPRAVMSPREEGQAEVGLGPLALGSPGLRLDRSAAASIGRDEVRPCRGWVWVLATRCRG